MPCFLLTWLALPHKSRFALLYEANAISASKVIISFQRFASGRGTPQGLLSSALPGRVEAELRRAEVCFWIIYGQTKSGEIALVAVFNARAIRDRTSFSCALGGP